MGLALKGVKRRRPMAAKKPTLVGLRDIPKTSKTIKVVCPACKREFERKAGRVFICLFCGCEASND